MKNFLFVFLGVLLFNGLGLSQDYSTSNLLAYYSLNGVAVDSGPNNFNGTVYHAQATMGIDSMTNSASFFNGTSDYVLVPNNCSNKLSNTDYSISVWIKVHEFTQRIGHAIVSKRCGTDNQGFLLHVIGTNHSYHNQGEIVFIVSGGYYDPYLKSATPVVAGEWTNIIVTFDNYAKIGRLYVNGELVDENAAFASPRADCASNFFIGKDPLNGYFFDGTIDELFIYNKVLSEEEISSLSSSLVGVDDRNALESEIHLFPNPNNGNLHIQTAVKDIDQIIIFDFSGRVIRQIPFSNEISLEGVPEGIYSIQFVDKNDTPLATKKLIVTK